MSSNKTFKCKICGKKYISKSSLIDHIEKSHSSSIPGGWNAARYENYLRTGKTEGHCVYCKKETGWNDTTGKYNRMCGSEACKKKARDLANKNYIGLHGKPYTINDPEQQKKMVYGRKNSGKYIFKDEDTGKEYIAMYDSSYGKDFFEMIDTFLNWDGSDIIAPSPHTYWYEYEGKKHFYIPDAYSTSLNLEIELKDGGDNPNNHPKIQAIDKVKEEKKDAVMASLKNEVNYIKICNKDYSEFFALLSSLKEKDVCHLPKWESRLESITESTGGINKSFIDSDKNPTNEYMTTMESSLTSKQNLIKRDMLLKDPMLNYDKLMEYYRKKLFYENLTNKEWQYIYNELLNVREYLQKVSNDKDKEHDKRMEFEAKKALDQVNKFIEYMEDKTVVTESVNSNKVPFYLVSWNYGSIVGNGVKLVTGSRYNHTSISLSPNLEECYTFSRNPETIKSHKTNGFCKESLSYMVNRYGDCEIKVNAVFVSPNSYKKLEKSLDYYIKNQDKTSFDYMNFVRIALGIEKDDMDEDKLNCSVFTDIILKDAGIDLTNGKTSNLVTPADLSDVDKNHKNIITVYSGKASDYDKNKISKITMESTTNELGRIIEKGQLREYAKYADLDSARGEIKESTILEITDIEEYDSSHKKKTGKHFRYIDIDTSEGIKYLTTDPKSKKNLDYIKKNRRGEVVVCTDDNKLAGYIFVCKDDRNDGYIQPLYLFKEYRGYGLSDKLLQDAVNKYGAIDLSVLEDNKVAINLYKKHGFVIVGNDNSNKSKDGQLLYMKLRTKLTESTYIEGTKNDTKYYPVFIFLSYTGTNMAKLIKSFTHDPYSHSSISFDTELTNMVSFNGDGMVDENIKTGIWKKNPDQIKYSLYMYLATAEEYDSMRNFVDELLGKRSKLKYNVLGLTNFIFGRGSEREDKFFCSEFVASVINAGNKNLIKTQPFMTSPYMLAKNKNFKFIKKGILKNYKPEVVDNIIKDILEEGGYEDVIIK